MKDRILVIAVLCYVVVSSVALTYAQVVDVQNERIEPVAEYKIGSTTVSVDTKMLAVANTSENEKIIEELRMLNHTLAEIRGLLKNQK